MLRLTRHLYLNIVLCTILGILLLDVLPDRVAGENEPVAYSPIGLSRTEAMLLNDVLDEIRQYRLNRALRNLETLTREYPSFKLAQIIYADLLMARAHVIRGFGHLSKEPSQELVGLLDEARMRWQHYLVRPPANAVPANFLQLNPATRRAILVDLNSSRLYLFENRQGTPSLVKDYYVSIGKNGAQKSIFGDRRTPVGIYFIIDYLVAEDLPDRYGDGAFPLNYPNEWDQRLNKTGSGIWLHGTPSNTYSRPPRSSDGCITLSNTDFSEIAPFMDIGQTPVIVTDRVITWLETQQWAHQRIRFVELLERWRQDWESRDTERYLSHYSKTFRNSEKNYDVWTDHKRRVNAAKTFIRVALSDISLYAATDDQNTLVATFLQDYESNNYRQQVKKRQYWRQEADGVWRIVYEGPA